MASAPARSSSGSDRRPRLGIAAAFVALGLLGGGCATDADPAGYANASIDRVVDGDTIDVFIDGTTERVRLIGLDTPEVGRDGRPGECYGAAASEFIATLLPAGTDVRIERDIVPRDHYGRLLGYVHRDDGLFVNDEILRRGYATPLTIDPNSAHAAGFVAAAAAAERQDLGLWSACND